MDSSSLCESVSIPVCSSSSSMSLDRLSVVSASSLTKHSNASTLQMSNTSYSCLELTDISSSSEDQHVITIKVTGEGTNNDVGCYNYSRQEYLTVLSVTPSPPPPPSFSSLSSNIATASLPAPPNPDYEIDDAIDEALDLLEQDKESTWISRICLNQENDTRYDDDLGKVNSNIEIFNEYETYNEVTEMKKSLERKVSNVEFVSYTSDQLLKQLDQIEDRRKKIEVLKNKANVEQIELFNKLTQILSRADIR